MSTFRTHYDNLKVARDAPPEVIKAAYRALAQRYHPDVNPSPDAARIMRVLNEAWAVLSDPIRKKQHDEWIETQLIDEAIAEASEAVDRRHRANQQASRQQTQEATRRPQPSTQAETTSLRRFDE